MIKFETKSLSFKIGLVLAIAHLTYFLYCMLPLGLRPWDDGQEMLCFVYIFLIDFFMIPVFILLGKCFSFMWIELGWLSAGYDLMLSTVISFGILGTFCWFFIPQLIVRVCKYFTRPKIKEQFR